MNVLQPQVHHLVELGADFHQNVTAIRSQEFQASIFWTSTLQTQDVSILLSAIKCHGRVQHNPQGPLVDPKSAKLSSCPGVSLPTHYSILILPPTHRHSTCLANAPPGRPMLDLTTPLSQDFNPNRAPECLKLYPWHCQVRLLSWSEGMQDHAELSSSDNGHSAWLRCQENVPKVSDSVEEAENGN